MYDLLVVGGGAAGFFGAIQAAERFPGLKITILEKSGKLLSKVKVSGGGRCNVTHHEFNAKALAQHYPRGEKVLRALFQKFQAKDVVNWFESRGITINVEADGRMFPSTNSSQTIIDCFLEQAKRYNIEIKLNEAVTKIERVNEGLKISTNLGRVLSVKNVLVAMGGHPQRSAYSWIEETGHTITPLVPSLFTFNDSAKRFAELMGVAVDRGVVRIAGTKFFQDGPVLITHWGLSGPAVIKLSAWAAEWLHQVNYEFIALVSWVGNRKEEDIREELLLIKQARPKLSVFGNPLFQLPQRLWIKLCAEAEIENEKIWGELSKRNLNKLIELLIRCPFQMRGKTTFKEEFVTCGGVDLNEINLETMESRLIPNLHFAGEVLNIDGETGGFNFQSAWTTAWTAAKHIAEKIKAGT